MKRRIWLTFILCVWLTGVVRSDDALIPPEILAQRSIDTGSVLEWSPDGSLLAVGANDGIRLYSDNLQFLKLLPQPVNNMCTVEWSPDGQYIAAITGGYRTGSQDSPGIYVWKVDTDTVQTVYGNPDEVGGSELTWSADSRWIASTSVHNQIEIWNALTGQRIRQIPMPQVVSDDGYTYDNGILFLDWSPDSARLAGVVSEIRIMLWDTITGKRILEIKKINNTDTDPYFFSHIVHWSPDGQMLADNYRVIDATTGETLDTFFKPIVFDDFPQPSYVVWHPGSRYLAIRHKDRIELHDTVQKMQISNFTVGEEPRLGCLEPKTIDWHPDGKRLATIANDGDVRIWQIFTDVPK